MTDYNSELFRAHKEEAVLTTATDNVVALDLWLGCSVGSRKVGQHQVNTSFHRSSAF